MDAQIAMIRKMISAEEIDLPAVSSLLFQVQEGFERRSHPSESACKKRRQEMMRGSYEFSPLIQVLAKLFVRYEQFVQVEFYLNYFFHKNIRDLDSDDRLVSYVKSALASTRVDVASEISTVIAERLYSRISFFDEEMLRDAENSAMRAETALNMMRLGLIRASKAEYRNKKKELTRKKEAATRWEEKKKNHWADAESKWQEICVMFPEFAEQSLDAIKGDPRAQLLSILQQRQERLSAALVKRVPIEEEALFYDSSI